MKTKIQIGDKVIRNGQTYYVSEVGANVVFTKDKPLGAKGTSTWTDEVKP